MKFPWLHSTEKGLLCSVLTLISVVTVGRAAQINSMTADNDKAISNKSTIGGGRRHGELGNQDVVKNRVNRV